MDYIVWLANNPRLLVLAEPLLSEALSSISRVATNSSSLTGSTYATATWNRPWRVIAKAEHGALGSNPRFVLTSLMGESQSLYADVHVESS